MNFEFIMGRYVPTDSILHRVDARIKLFYTIAGIIVLFMLNSWESIALYTVFVLGMIALSKMGMTLAVKTIKSIWILILLVFVFQMFDSTGRIIIDLGFIKLTEEGLLQSAKVSVRLILLIWFSTVFTATTSPLKIADSVESILKFFRVKAQYAHEISMIMSIAIRFIPVISLEANQIIKAQKSRGARFDNGNIINRIKAFFPIIIPLLVNTFKRADELALAMDVRCYNGHSGRTKYNEMTAGVSDWITLIVMAGLFSLFILADKTLFI